MDSQRRAAVDVHMERLSRYDWNDCPSNRLVHLYAQKALAENENEAIRSQMVARGFVTRHLGRRSVSNLFFHRICDAGQRRHLQLK